jgi:sodium/hydrogen antiporter
MGAAPIEPTLARDPLRVHDAFDGGAACPQGTGGWTRMSVTLAVVAAFFLLYALVSSRVDASVLTGPMLFVAFGLLIGANGLELLTPQDGHAASLLYEATLVLVLFSDARAVSSRGLRRESFVPSRLLAVGLPLTILAGAVLAIPLLAGFGVWELAAMAAVLAPTDASLGIAVVTNRRVPALIRHALNVESGLNDGIVLPFLTIFLALAAESASLTRPWDVFLVFVRALVFSTAVGIAVGWLGSRLIVAASARGWMSDGWRQLSVIALAFGAYGATVAVKGGSGFIAAWVAGFVAGLGLSDRFETIGHFSEDLGSALTTLAYLAFGALLLGPAIVDSAWQMWAYALLSLTVVRMVPVALALAGTRLRRPTVAFVGWFGPRGLASIIFAELVVERALPHTQAITAVVALTVGLSVLLHGLTAWPSVQSYGAWYERAKAADPDLAESVRVARPVERRRVRLTGPPGRTTERTDLE